ncbi:hypothetical protein QTI17_31370 [Variovorax sp. J31P179]|uniref:hypothetical protein n=1 Tax=Variovorax sp. J31P179 TaxID=3053508 RepID=UPI002577020A|nr:hypothetical protein [Variovorax sp. J31P179]MDM0085096.1 hypothetical protein [Variovorax sp. J31P179]
MSTDKTDDGCCDQTCDSGRRNRFYPNKRTTPDTWTVEQDFQQQRRRLLNRAMHGWGVVYGFKLDLLDDDRCSGDGGKRLVADEGFALDPCGRELLQVGKLPLEVADCLAFDAKGHYLEPPKQHSGKRDPNFPWPSQPGEQHFLLHAHYAERLIAPVAVRDPCQCEGQEWDQVCETIRYSLTPVDCAECCRQQRCELKCDCSRGPCCPEGEHKPTERGGCRCLCEHLLQLDPTPECCSLTTISKGLRVDLRHGVPLACLKLGRDQCADWTFSDITDVCGPRRLVKRNDLLFDLIRGCDLTHISSISWSDWHRNKNGIVGLDEFTTKFGDGGMTDFRVEFSRPVDVATIKPDCFTMTLIARDDEDGWGRTLRVPIVDVETDKAGSTGYSTKARIVVDASWAKGAFDRNSVFSSGITRFEITVRGDYLLDCNGQMVDANARGLQSAPTGNGTPGDTFFSTFLIARKEVTDSENSNII